MGFIRSFLKGNRESCINNHGIQTEKHKKDNPKKHKKDNPLKTNLRENINLIKRTMGESFDLVIREFRAGKNSEISIATIYIDGLADKVFVQDFILKVLMLELKKTKIKPSSGEDFYEVLKDLTLTVGDITEIENLDSLYEYVLSGDTVILFDGYSKGLAANSKGWKDRGVTEPSTQVSIRGPRESFSETLQTSLSLIRRRIKDCNLRIEPKSIGRVTKTKVAMVYIKGIANDKIVNEVRVRLGRIDIDGILDSGYLEELIQDVTFTPFPTVFASERPDAVSAGLLEGRIAIVMDGSPFALIIPALFVHFFQSSEDYYQRFDITTLVRILRYIAFFITILAPSVYIAITIYHQEMIPFPLLISIAAQRSAIPFPALFEALLMEITFELLREAGIRMPKAIGSALSIVGALVLGDAAVRAGIVSPIMVIIVAITAISSLMSPNYSMAAAARILRFIFMILAVTFGILGITMGLILLTLHLCSLRSFGVPYTAPLAPFIAAEQKDAIVRVPWWMMLTRPRLITQNNLTRQQDSAMAKPKPPKRR